MRSYLTVIVSTISPNVSDKAFVYLAPILSVGLSRVEIMMFVRILAPFAVMSRGDIESVSVTVVVVGEPFCNPVIVRSGFASVIEPADSFDPITAVTVVAPAPILVLCAVGKLGLERGVCRSEGYKFVAVRLG